MIQQAIAQGDIGYVIEYYSKHPGVGQILYTPRNRSSIGVDRPRVDTPRPAQEDELSIDNAIILATIHKRQDIVAALMEIKNEDMNYVVSYASLSFIKQHPRIVWTVPLAMKLIARATVHEYNDVISIINAFDYKDYAEIIVNIRGHCRPRITAAYVDKFGKHRKKIDHLVKKILASDDDVIVEDIIVKCIYTMSVSMLRKCATEIINRGMSCSLFEDVVSCRDFGKAARLKMTVVGKLRGYDKKYMQVLTGYKDNP